MTFLASIFLAFWLLAAVMGVALAAEAALVWLAERWSPTPRHLDPADPLVQERAVRMVRQRDGRHGSR